MDLLIPPLFSSHTPFPFKAKKAHLNLTRWLYLNYFSTSSNRCQERSYLQRDVIFRDVKRQFDSCISAYTLVPHQVCQNV